MSLGARAKWSHYRVVCPRTDCSGVEDITAIKGTLIRIRSIFEASCFSGCLFEMSARSDDIESSSVWHPRRLPGTCCPIILRSLPRLNCLCKYGVTVLFFIFCLWVWRLCFPENSTTATQSRYRTIIQMPTNGGQECPDTLYEERECDSVGVCPVYR